MRSYIPRSFLIALACLLAASACLQAQPKVVISQVYGGGGNSGAQYSNDFVELFNSGDQSQDVTGWSVQYFPAAGGPTSQWQQATLAGVIAPGQYYLVRLASGSTPSAALPAADASGSINMSATAGKVALRNNSTLFPTGTVCPLPDATIADFVGFGSANCSETSPTGTLSNTTAAARKNNGCTDTGSNLNDFITTGAPSPRNSGTPANPCQSPAPLTATGTSSPAPVQAGSAVLLTAAAVPASNPASTGLSVFCDLNSIGGPGSQPLAGTGPFTLNYTVPAATPPGIHNLVCKVSDAELRSTNFGITVNVSGPPTPPTATGSASPNTVETGQTTNLRAAVTPGANPTSTGIAVVCDLSPIGGVLAQSFNGTGTGPYTFDYTVPAGTPYAAHTLQCTVSDAQARSSNFTIRLTVTSPLTAAKIYEINGPGASSPMAGYKIRTTGVVTAIRGATSSVRGFYIESMPADRDLNPLTSEGLLVFTGSSAPPACAVAGNYIRIDGLVQDFVSSTSPLGSVPLTELSSPSNCEVLGTGMLGSLPPAASIADGSLDPNGSATQSRQWLGMRVSVPASTVVAPSLGDLDEATAQATPSGTFFITARSGGPRSFRGPGILDTRRPADAAATIPSYNGSPEVLRVETTGLTGGTTFEIAPGALISNLSGIMDYTTAQGQYTIYSNAAGIGSITAGAPLSATPVPPPLATDLTIANFNIERFFNDQNEGNGAGATLTPAAYQGRLNKLSLAVRNVMRMPDIIGFEEVEGPKAGSANLTYPVINDIVNKINSDAAAAGQGDPAYAYCMYPTNDPGAIAVAFIYKSNKVTAQDCTQFGALTQYTEPGGGTALLNDRPPVALRALVKAPGSDSALPVRIVVNHLRSLGSIDQPGAGNGDRVRTKRNEQARYLAKLLTGNLPEQSQDWNTTEDLVLLGDFNAYQFNDGLVDVMGCIAGTPAPADQQYFTPVQLAVTSPCPAIAAPPLINLTSLDPVNRYSYTFSGALQTIDHVLVNSIALPRVRREVYARNDTDYPEGVTYRNDFARPERLSDHDIPVVYLTLPVEVTSRVSVESSPVTRNPGKDRYHATIRVKNAGTATLDGPIYVFFKNLPAGVTLPDLPLYNGVPYVTIDVHNGLKPHASSPAAVVYFSNPANVPITYTAVVFDGSF
jgi:predicted extracellular nuclease